MIVIVAFILAAMIEAFRDLNRITKSPVGPTVFQIYLSSKGAFELEESLQELLRCEQSFNPIDRWRVPGLRENIRQLSLKEEKESKDIMLLTGDEDAPKIPVRITRKTLRDWSMSGKLLVSTGILTVAFNENNFDDIIESDTFAILTL